MDPLVELALQTRTLEELLSGAKTAGIKITTEEALLRQVKKEWLAEKKRQVSEDYSERMLPETLPCRGIGLGGRIYQIYRIAHCKPPTPDYASIIHRTISSQAVGLFLAEQNVARHFDLFSVMEINDHTAPKYWLAKILAKGYWNGIQTVIFTPTELRKKVLQYYHSRHPKNKLSPEELFSL